MDVSKPVRSAIYLSGNKFKLFKDIAPHLESGGDRKVLLDLFTGSGCVSLNAVNCGLGFDKIIANDKMSQIIDMHKCIQTGEQFIDEIGFTNTLYDKDKTNFYYLIDEYNRGLEENEDIGFRSGILLNLIYRSNSNMMRFSKDGKFNMTFGERSCFNRARLMKHSELSENIEFISLDFSLALDKLYREGYDLKNTIIYVDSPYSSTTAVYNKDWTSGDDRVLLQRLKWLHQEGAKIVMSNVFENRGKVNQWLIDWCEDNKDLFEVHEMNISYSNSSFRKSDKKTREVLIVSKEIV